jgi:rubrerythrin
VERQAAAFYRRFAEHAKDADVKELCLKLADDEIGHLNFIENILSGWKSLPVDQADLEAMDADRKLRSLFLSPPDSNAIQSEIVAYALNAEKRMVAFYTGFEKEFKSAWKILKIRDMVEEERSHVSKLSEMLPSS